MGSHFTRQLGAESGIQLNPLRDDSEIPVLDNFDQVFGIMMRSTRGRIDKPFKVDRGNVFRRLGKGEPIRISALNESWVQVVEAVNKGAYEAVVQRLVTSAATIKWVVVRVDPDSGEFLFSVSDEAPEAPFLFAVKHLECFNDGIRIEFRADEKRLGGVGLANDRVTLRLTDREGGLLHEFYGSLDREALDDYGNSAYLPDVAQTRTDAVDIEIGMLEATIAPGSRAYGYDDHGRERWAKSGVLVCFEEGGTAYMFSPTVCWNGSIVKRCGSVVQILQTYS